MKEIRVLAISHMFPTKIYRRHGIFICREARMLRDFGVNCSFLVGRPWTPWPLSMFSRWKVFSSENPLEPPFGLEARQATYLRPPGAWYLRHEGPVMARALLGPASRWHRERPFDVVLGVEMLADTHSAVQIGKHL